MIQNNISTNVFFNNLIKIAKQIHEAPQNEIQSMIAMLHHNLTKEKPEENLLEIIFLEALHLRITNLHRSEEHIYLKQFDIPQINLFELLIQHFPPVKYAQQYTSSTLFKSLSTYKKAVLLDIGIGTGYQVRTLINELLVNGSKLESLTIIGVEPNLISLTQAEKELSGLDVNFELQFIAVNSFAEEVNYIEILQNIEAYEALLVNASFTIHHIQSLEKRLALFHKIKEIRPDLFIISEPNSNHFTTNYLERFQNCYRHFRIIYDLIDSLSLLDREKLILKSFFNREIKDIVANSNWVERHSDISFWMNMINSVGFKAKKLPFPDEIIEGHDFKPVWQEDGFWSLDFRDQATVSIIAVQ